MDVLAFAIALLALAAFVAAPLYRQASAPMRSFRTPASEAAEVALGDLDIDRASGLVDEASYADERAALQARLAQERPPAD